MNQVQGAIKVIEEGVALRDIEETLGWLEQRFKTCFLNIEVTLKFRLFQHRVTLGILVLKVMCRNDVITE